MKSRWLSFALVLGPASAAAQLTGNPPALDLPLIPIALVTLAMMLIAWGLVFYLRKRGGTRWFAPTDRSSAIRLLDRIVLDGKVTVYLLQVNSRQVLVSSSVHAVSVTELDRAPVGPLAASQEGASA